MTLAAGTRLGPYEIVAPIGAGGMGEVYKARDTRLERMVAVKVLPSDMSASPEVRQRFEREAKTISQLSHPHICALYDVGREGETEYLVMELLEGDTLSDRLAKGPLPLEQTLRYGTEIADARSDIFAFGAVLYEMATGKTAFSGASRASLITTIMSEDPPAISSVQRMSPPALDRVVKTCLAKDPDDRWQSARDVMSQLRWIAEGSSQPGSLPPPTVAPAASSRRRRLLLLGAGVAVVLLALGGIT